MNLRDQRLLSPRKLALGYAIALSVLLVNAVVTFWNVQSIGKNWSDLSLTHEVLIGLDELLSNVRDAETGQRGYLLTGEESYLEPYRISRAVLDESIARVMALTANNGIRHEHSQGIDETILAKLAELEETIKLRQEKNPDAALAIVKTGRGKELMDRLRGQISAMRADEIRTRDGLKARLERGIRNTLVTFLLASVLSGLLLLVVQYMDRASRRAQ